MLRLLTTLTCLAIGQPLLAQVNISTSGTTSNINISDPNGLLYTGVSGSPYFPQEAFNPGKLSNATVTTERPLRFNMASGMPEYLDGNKVMTPAASVNKILIAAPGADPLLFKNGFPAVDKQGPTAFYQVLADGQRLNLLVFRYSSIKEGKEPMDNNFGKKWFESGERYYLYRPDSKTMQAVNSPKALLNAIPDKTAQLKQYAADQKLKLKDWNDATQLVKYADGL